MSTSLRYIYGIFFSYSEKSMLSVAANLCEILAIFACFVCAGGFYFILEQSLQRSLIIMQNNSHCDCIR